MRAEVYLALGSNLEDKRWNIERAVERLREISTGLTVSSMYETAPFGVTLQPAFVNAVCGMWTRVRACSSCCARYEKSSGKRGCAGPC